MVPWGIKEYLNHYFYMVSESILNGSLCLSRSRQVVLSVRGGVVATYPSTGGWGKTQRYVFQERKCAGVVTNVYSRKTLEKPKDEGLQILKIRVRELFTHREGISTPHARHEGWQPLIECAKHDFKIMYFPFLYFYVFSLFIFFIFLFLRSTGVLPLLLRILRCDEESRPT